MNIQYKIGAFTVASLLLCACGSDSGSSSSPAEESHEHSLMISQTNTDVLSVLEEGAAESLTDTAAANGAELLLSDNGEAAAIITASSVQFVATHHEEESGAEEEHELPEVSSLSITGSGIQVQDSFGQTSVLMESIKVINSNGHFSVLVDGATKFVPYEVLGTATPEAEGMNLSAIETYPALLLHEDDTHGLLTLIFYGTNAVVYEDTNPSVEAEHTVSCATVNSTAHVGEFAVVSCDNKSFSVKVKEVDGEHEAVITTLVGITTAVEWQSRAGVFVGLGADNKFYVLEEENEALVLEGGVGFAAPTDMCAWGIDSLAADIFTLTKSELAVYNHEGAKDAGLALDESPNATCASLTLTTASQAVFVLDNSAQKLYEIDKEDGASLYHIHGRENVSVNDVAAAVSFHEVGTEGSHDH